MLPCVGGVCLGGPGSGKALQSEKIEERYSLKRLCPGDILCSELQSYSERGRFLRDLLERGEQLPEVHNHINVHLGEIIIIQLVIFYALRV